MGAPTVLPKPACFVVAKYLAQHGISIARPLDFGTTGTSRFELRRLAGALSNGASIALLIPLRLELDKQKGPVAGRPGLFFFGVRSPDGAERNQGLGNAEKPSRISLALHPGDRPSRFTRRSKPCEQPSPARPRPRPCGSRRASSGPAPRRCTAPGAASTCRSPAPSGPRS